MISEIIENTIYGSGEWILFVPTVTTFLLFSCIVVWFIYGIFYKKIKISNFKREDAIILFIIIGVAFTARILAPPMVGAGGGDEYDYVSVGREIAKSGQYREPALIGPPGIYFKPYYTYPALVAIASFFTKTSLSLGRSINIILGSLTVLLVYLLTNRIYNKKVSIIASFLVAILPIGIHMSNTPESQVISVFSFLLFLFFFYKYLDRNDIYYGLGSVFLFSMVLISRSLNWVFLPYFIAMILIYKGKDLLNKRTLLFVLILISFTWLAFFQGIFIGVIKEGAEASGFGANIGKNIGYLLNQVFAEEKYYAIFSLFGISGMLLSLKKISRRKNMLLFIPFLLYTAFILFYRWTSQGGPFSKFYYLPYVLLSIWSAFMLYKLYNYLKKHIGYENIIKILFIVSLGLFGGWCVFSAIHFPRDVTSLTAEKAVGVAKQIYPNCTVVTYDTRPVRVMGFEVLEIPEEKGKTANETWYKEKTNSNCLLYYNEPWEEKYIKRFEREFKDKMKFICNKSFRDYGASVYLIDLGNN